MKRPCPRRRAWAWAVAALALSANAAALPLDPKAVGLHKGVTFTDPSPLATQAELTRRLLGPLGAAGPAAATARPGKTPPEPALDLAAETFTVFVPAEVLPGGYGLLVFLPPWDEATLPPGWGPVLDRRGFLFVTPAKAGNAADVRARRAPLALLAAVNMMNRFPVDPARVFVGGFSGGGRVAIRLALAYPDLFRGALLNAGSDPIGAADAPMPPADLWRRFQASRLVYVTGERDPVRLAEDAPSLDSLRRWCVFGAESQTAAWKGHDIAGALALDRALATLSRPVPADPARRAACTAGVEKALDARLAREAALRAGGALADADRERAAIEAKYGWLAVDREAGAPATAPPPR